MPVHLDPRLDADLIENLRRHPDLQTIDNPGSASAPLLGPRNLALAWLVYYTLRNPSWPLSAAFWIVALLAITVAAALAVPVR